MELVKNIHFDYRLIGVGLNVGGSVTLNLGTNVMKLGHNIRKNALSSKDELATSKHNGKVPDDSSHSYSSVTSEKLGPRPKVWYLGLFLFVAGSLVTFSSFGFAPQSLLAALGSCQFISNCIFGRVILKEELTAKILWGTFVILAGNVIVVCFSPTKTTRYTTKDLINLYDFDYQMFLLAELFVLICLQLTYMAYEERLNMVEDDPAILPYRGTSIVMPVCYAMFSAAIGTQSALQSKCFSELLTLTCAGQNQFSSPFTYFVIVAWFITCAFWLYRMNRALALFDGLFIIPTLQVFWVFFAIIGGGVYFEEFVTIGPLRLFGFICGVVVVFSGVIIIAPTSKKEAKSDEEPDDQDLGGFTESELNRLAFYEKQKTRLINFGYDQPMLTNDRDLKRFADKMGRTYETAQNYGEEGLSKIPGVKQLKETHIFSCAKESVPASLNDEDTIPDDQISTPYIESPYQQKEEKKAFSIMSRFRKNQQQKPRSSSSAENANPSDRVLRRRDPGVGRHDSNTPV